MVGNKSSQLSSSLVSLGIVCGSNKSCLGAYLCFLWLYLVWYVVGLTLNDIWFNLLTSGVSIHFIWCVFDKVIGLGEYLLYLYACPFLVHLFSISNFSLNLICGFGKIKMNSV